MLVRAETLEDVSPKSPEASMAVEELQKGLRMERSYSKAKEEEVQELKKSNGYGYVSRICKQRILFLHIITCTAQ